MIEGLPIGIIVNGLGSVGLVVLFGWMLATGRLYTRGQVEEMKQAHTDAMDRLETATTREVTDANHERDEWRTQARIENSIATELNQQNQAMLNAFGPTLTDFLQSIRQPARSEDR